MPRGPKPSKPAPFFGQRLAAFRTAKGLSQAQLGEELGMTRDLVAYYERAAKNPSLDQVKRLADFFGVTVGEMLKDSSPRVATKPGPVSRLEELAAKAAKMPRADQRAAIKMLEGLLSG
ncbi:MAG: helix-turn-helix domain-containing protein [Opitutaceae bacterium]